MPDIAHATAASAPVTYHGKQYSIRPLTPDDYGELTMWVRSRLLASARASTAGLTRREADAAMEQAYRLVDGLDWYSVAGSGMTEDRWGRYIWQHFKKTYPQITEAEILASLRADVTELGDVIDAIVLFYGTKETKKEGGAASDENPTEAPLT